MPSPLGSIFSLLDTMKRNLTPRGIAGTAERTGQNLEAFTKKMETAQKGDKQAQKEVSEQMLEQVLNMSPAGIVVPARNQIPKATIDKFMNELRKGKAPQRLYEDFGGLYYDSVDKLVKEVQSDVGVKLNKGAIRRSGPVTAMHEPTQWVDLMQNKTKLEDLIDHPDLFMMYPELRNVNVVSDVFNPHGGFFSADSSTIGLGATRSEKAMTSTLLHEVQHAIQSIEGMTRGGNPGMFYQNPGRIDDAAVALRNRQNDIRSLYDAAGKSLSERLNDPMWTALNNADRELSGVATAAHQNYLRLGGEAESRAVQKQFETGNYKQLPLSMLTDLTGPRLPSADAVTPVDAVPGVQAIIDWLLTAPAHQGVKP